MNCEVFHLKELEVEQYQIREVLRCILHTIMFNRALGLVRPREVECELFDITYVQCGDSHTEKKIEEKIDHFLTWVEKHPDKKSRVCLSFYETRNKHVGWFSKVERLYWEQWCIQLHVLRAGPHEVKKQVYDGAPSGNNGETVLDERQRRNATLEAALRDVIIEVLSIVNEKKDHIPPVQQPDVVVSFPFEISIPRYKMDGRNSSCDAICLV
uniref:Autophagy-related protein 101 n=1 Tax=Physcomitrium patens TaxID=3218 RepID=A0A7I4F0Z5_PHYPA